MKLKIRAVLEDCIETGVRRGYDRAHKYIEDPTRETIIEHIEESVMAAIHEYFIFDTDE